MPCCHADFAAVEGSDRGFTIGMPTFTFGPGVLAEAGANIVICSRRLDVCKQAIADIEKIGVQGLAVACDVTKADQVEALKDAVLKKFGRVDILVNNAGRAWVAPPEDTPLERWQQVFDLNITAPFLCAQAFGREFIKQKRGKIVNIASDSAILPTPLGAHYSASKAGVLAITKTLALELAPYGIFVNAVAPGLTDTAQPRFGMTEAELARAGADAPLGRIATPDEIAAGIVTVLERTDA